MSQLQDYTDVSVALSEVLAEIGLNDVIVNERRRTFLVMESMSNVTWSMKGSSYKHYNFGSQTEGTTTRGLDSDVDSVSTISDMNVIHELKDWKQGVCNLLMVEDEATSPGYCMLQILRTDVPDPETEIFNENCFRDRQGRIFWKNTAYVTERHGLEEQHGPAFTVQGGNGTVTTDLVTAYTCTSQPPVVQRWLSQLQGPWPSENIKQTIAKSPCFVVPVGSKRSAHESLEWRMSTSLAERYLMFSLNVTQLQVYVLMKMLLKTSINHNVPEESHISSFMCKTVVLHCVQNTDHNAWQSHMLIQCLLFSLFILYACVVLENCPHFIIRSNNLMAGRFTQQAKYQLQQNLRCIFDDIVSRRKFTLPIDNVAGRLVQKLSSLMFGTRYRASDKECQTISFSLRMNCARATQKYVRLLLKWLTENSVRERITQLQQYVQRLEDIYREGDANERSACRLLRPYHYTTLGCLLASQSIQTSAIISLQAIAFFSRGLNSDVTSSRLKLASVFFCAGDMEKAEITLRDLESRYNISVCTPVCPCTDFAFRTVQTRVEALCLASDESDIPKNTCACVFFTQDEKNCIPKELLYEMYRATREDVLFRIRFLVDRMNWAVVDSLPYLHFLCYKVYGRLERRADQQRALYNLKVAIHTEHNLGHKETALNLLGQCMEQENRWNEALQCYSWSLNICPKHNVAKYHVCRLLYMKYRQNQA